MNWCVYPSTANTTHSFLTSQTVKRFSKHNTIFKHMLENSRQDWQNIKMVTRNTTSKSAYTDPSPEPQEFHRQRNIDGHEWEVHVSFPFAEFHNIDHNKNYPIANTHTNYRNLSTLTHAQVNYSIPPTRYMWARDNHWSFTSSCKHNYQ